MQQECRTSRILFFHYPPPFQFVPLLRLLVLSSHYFFITTRFLRCWCLASWSLDPVLFLPLVISFLSVLVFEKKVTNTRSFLFGELDRLFPSRQLHLHAAMQEQCGDGGGHWSEPAWEVRLNGFCSHVDTEYIAALLRRAGKTRRLNSAVNFPGSVHPRHIRHLKKREGYYLLWMKPQLCASYSNTVRCAVLQWCIYVLQALHLPWVFTVVLLNQLGVCYCLICMATSNK